MLANDSTGSDRPLHGVFTPLASGYFISTSKDNSRFDEGLKFTVYTLGELSLAMEFNNSIHSLHKPGVAMARLC